MSISFCWSPITCGLASRNLLIFFFGATLFFIDYYFFCCLSKTLFWLAISLHKYLRKTGKTLIWFLLNLSTFSRSFKRTSNAILSSTIAVFRIDNREVGELFFSANNFIISPPHFGVEIFEIISSKIASRFCTTTYREFKGLTIFLRYNPIAFYSNQMFSSRRPISRALV